MADEIKLKSTLTIVNGLLRDNVSPDQFKITQTNGRIYKRVHTIGTTEESITSFGDVATPGVMVLYNLDGTNFVQWGFATTDYGGHLTANDGSSTKGMPIAIFYGLSGVELYLKADTAACEVLVVVYDR